MVSTASWLISDLIMIPKKIHYCWLSGDASPELVQKCMDSWHKHMPDWEYVLWDMERIKDIDSVWLKECIEAKKWAFAADFIRVYALYHEGGIYLDSDVIIFQSLEKFLENRFFIGRENITYPTFEDGVQVFLTSHCFGAEQGHPFLKKNLGYYQDRHFMASRAEDIPTELRYDMLMMPYIQSKLMEPLGYKPDPLAEGRQSLQDGIEIYPSNFFCWRSVLPVPAMTERYAQHLGQGGWREPEYWAKREPKAITISYKIRWRLEILMDRIAEKFGYKLIRLHYGGGS